MNCCDKISWIHLIYINNPVFPMQLKNNLHFFLHLYFTSNLPVMRNILFMIIFLVPSLLYAQKNPLPKPVAPYSPVVQAGNTFYLAGQIPRVPETGEMIRGDIRKATRQVMENIDRILKQNGLDFSNVVKCTVYLKDLDNYSAMNEVYASYFHGNYPARVAVQVARLPLDADIEISCIAVKKIMNREME